MKPMGWRFLVLTDLGAPSPGPVRLPAGGPDTWLPALKLKFADEASFRPAGASSEVLQDPGFQRVESAFRGLKLLMEHAGEGVRVDVLSASAKDLGARFRESVFEPEMKTIQDPPLALILADFDFSHQQADLAAISELAEMAKVLQAPIVAQASPAFFGLKQLNLLPKLNDVPQRLTDGAHAGWIKFQKQEAARWAALTLNRYLQRAPYEGENVDPAKPETYLWGRGVWLLGASAARAVRSSGHALDLSGLRAGQFKGLPTRAYPKAANQTVPLSAEVPVPEQMALELSRVGFITVVGFLGSDSVMLPIAVNVHREKPGRLTVSGTLGYQLLAGRLAQLCALLLEELPADAAEAVAFLKRSLVEFLGPLAGPAPDAAVTVAPAEAKGPDGRSVPLAEITVQPAARIEGMEFKYVFQLPLRV